MIFAETQGERRIGGLGVSVLDDQELLWNKGRANIHSAPFR
jgi:hypothetical protein